MGVVVVMTMTGRKVTVIMMMTGRMVTVTVMRRMMEKILVKGHQ